MLALKVGTRTHSLQSLSRGARTRVTSGAGVLGLGFGAAHTRIVSDA
jgi:hypothetical protein